MNWTRDDEKRARRTAEDVEGKIHPFVVDYGDGYTDAEIDKLSTRESVYQAIREAVERERQATDAARARVAELEADVAKLADPEIRRQLVADLVAEVRR